MLRVRTTDRRGYSTTTLPRVCQLCVRNVTRLSNVTGLSVLFQWVAWLPAPPSLLEACQRHVWNTKHGAPSSAGQWIRTLPHWLSKPFLFDTVGTPLQGSCTEVKCFFRRPDHTRAVGHITSPSSGSLRHSTQYTGPTFCSFHERHGIQTGAEANCIYLFFQQGVHSIEPFRCPSVHIVPPTPFSTSNCTRSTSTLSSSLVSPVCFFSCFVCCFVFASLSLTTTCQKYVYSNYCRSFLCLVSDILW